MSVRIPLNQIVTSRYTSGKEYIYETSYKEYIGYYYELNGKIFAGKEFRYDAPILIKINSDSINILKLNPKTNLYSAISNSTMTKEKKIVSIPLILSDGTKYFAKKLNSNPIRIFFVSEDTYNENFNKNVLYSFTFLNFDMEWGFSITDQNRKDIPEIDLFLKEYSQNSE